MTELTKEQLIEEAKLKIAITKCHPNSGMARVEGELFKIARASLEAEPIAWRYRYVKKALRTWGSRGLVTGNMYRKKRIVTTGRTINSGLYLTSSPSRVHQGLVKALHFYEQLKRENPRHPATRLMDRLCRNDQPTEKAETSYRLKGIRR
ncbi:hypothetical protein ACLK17_12165 [Escherichia coli]